MTTCGHMADNGRSNKWLISKKTLIITSKQVKIIYWKYLWCFWIEVDHKTIRILYEFLLSTRSDDVQMDRGPGWAEADHDLTITINIQLFRRRSI